MPRPPKGMFRIRNGRSWYVRFFHGGKDRWVCLGPDYDDACRKYRQIKRGELPATRVTVEDATQRWLATYVQTARSEGNQKIARSRVGRYLVAFMGWKFLGKVSPDDLREYRLWLEGRGLSLQTVVHVLADARCFLRWCEDAGYLERAPVPRHLMPRIQEKAPDRLSDEEVVTVRSLPGTLGFTARLGLLTGLRWGEMARALTADIRGGILTVQKTKSGKLRRVPLPAEILLELRGRVGKLIGHGEKSVGAFNRDVKTKTGITRFHAHQLRHTFACRWIEAGGSLPALQQLLGHASIVTTQRYARLSDEAVFEEAKRVQTVEETVEGRLDPVRQSRVSSGESIS